MNKPNTISGIIFFKKIKGLYNLNFEINHTTFTKAKAPISLTHWPGQRDLPVAIIIKTGITLIYKIRSSPFHQNGN